MGKGSSRTAAGDEMEEITSSKFLFQKKYEIYQICKIEHLCTELPQGVTLMQSIPHEEHIYTYGI